MQKTFSAKIDLEVIQEIERIHVESGNATKSETLAKIVRGYPSQKQVEFDIELSAEQAEQFEKIHAKSGNATHGETFTDLVNHDYLSRKLGFCQQAAEAVKTNK